MIVFDPSVVRGTYVSGAIGFDARERRGTVEARVVSRTKIEPKVLINALPPCSEFSMRCKIVPFAWLGAGLGSLFLNVADFKGIHAG